MNRIVTGVLTGLTWLLLIIFGPFPLFWLTVCALSALALREYLAITLPQESKQARTALLSFGLFPALLSFTADAAFLLSGFFLSLAGLFLYLIFRYARLRDPFSLMSRGCLGYLYLGLGSSCLIMLMALPQGRAWLLLLSATTAASDTAAFYFGSRFGRHKLCPAISPAKTWEGFYGGLAGATAGALLMRHFFLPAEGLAWLLPLILLLAALGAAGDLVESIIKRAFAVKDSGTILPGHGGLLDRMDSLLLTAPALYFLLYYRGLACP